MHVFRLLSRRWTVAAAAVTGAVAFALPAGATTTTTTTPSHGFASSSLTVLQLHLAGQTVTAGRIAMVAGTNKTPHTVRLVVTPVSSTATGPVGQQTITPQSNPASVPSTPKSIALPGGLGKVIGPTFAVQAKDGATAALASAKLTAPGGVQLTQVVPVTINLNAAVLSDMAKVASTGATAEKSFSLGNLSLPSVADLLAALGIDLNALLDTLTQGNLSKIASVVTSVTSGAVSTANGAVDTAQAALQSASQTPANSLDAANAELADAEQSVVDDNSAFASAWSSAFGALDPTTQGLVNTALSTAGLPNPPSADDLNGWSAAASTLQPLFDAVDTTLWPAIASAATTVATAENVVTLVNNLIDALQSLVQSVLDAINANNTPVASLGGISLVTKAIAAKTPAAGASVKVATVNVLGVTTTLSSLVQTLTSQLAPLSQALNSVAGLSFTPPKIGIGVPAHGTSRSGQTRHAFANVSAVTVTLPRITLPSALHAAGAPAAVSGSVSLGVLGEQANWTPAISHTVTTPDQPQGSNNPSLSDTGGRVALPILATVLIAAAAVLRRRWVRA